MPVITTKYLGPTNTKGARIKVASDTGHASTYPYDHSASNPHIAALGQYLKQHYRGRVIHWTQNTKGGLTAIVGGNAIAN